MNAKTMNRGAGEVFTTGEVARMLEVNFRTVIRWAERGLLVSYRLPGRGDYRFRAEDLRHFLREHAMPVPEALLEEAEVADAVATGPVTGQKMALIVDDEPAMARAIERALKRGGFETHIATGGFEAGMLLHAEKPALMTLDLHMPGLNGHEVLQLMKAREGISTRVLVVSGDSRGAQQAVQDGAHGAITKPFTQEELMAAVDMVMADGEALC